MKYASLSTQRPVVQWLVTLQMNKQKCSLPLKVVTFYDAVTFSTVPQNFSLRLHLCCLQHLLCECHFLVKLSLYAYTYIVPFGKLAPYPKYV